MSTSDLVIFVCEFTKKNKNSVAILIKYGIIYINGIL